VMIREGLYDEEYVATRTDGFEELKGHLEFYTPELAAEICGVPVEDIYYVAREYAKASPGAAICYTLGITEHSCGSHNVQALANLGMLGGNFGVPNAGVNPLRGQNNVQGASDSGAIPTDLPGYQKLERPGEVREGLGRVPAGPSRHHEDHRDGPDDQGPRSRGVRDGREHRGV